MSHFGEDFLERKKPKIEIANSSDLCQLDFICGLIKLSRKEMMQKPFNLKKKESVWTRISLKTPQEAFTARCCEDTALRFTAFNF